MLILNLDEERSELPHQIIFKETQKLKTSTTIDLNFKIDIDFKNKLIQLAKEYQSKFPNVSIKSSCLFIKENSSKIIESTNFFPENTRLIERVYFLIHDLKIIDLICPVCGKFRRFFNPKTGYAAGCSHNHSNSVQSHKLAPTVSSKISQSLKNRTREQKSQSAEKAKQTFAKNHPNKTMSDILKETYAKYPNLKSQIGKSRSNWAKLHPKETKESCKKAGETMRNKIDSNGNNHYQRVHLKKLEIGSDGLNFYQRQLKKDLTPDKNGLNKFERTRKKQEALGKWVKISDLPDFKQYRYWVWKHTNKQPIETLKNFEKRGKHYKGSNENVYSLDHIYSIKEGFKNNVPPFIIGSIHNLRFLRWDKNLAKKDKCDISLDSLVSKFYSNK